MIVIIMFIFFNGVVGASEIISLVKKEGANIVRKSWIAVVSKDHVMKGVDEGFVQACHGKRAPLVRMKKDDWLVFYSPKLSMEGKQPYQKFTAIGKILDDTTYQFDMGGGFVPHRRDVSFFKEANEIPIHDLISSLTFIKNKKNWGMAFRYGHLEIPIIDLNIIREAMGIKNA